MQRQNLLFTFLLILAFSCKRIDVSRITKIETLEVSFNNNQLIANGNLIDASDAGISDYGFCFGDYPNPDLSGRFLSAGKSKTLGQFSDTLKDIFANKIYYVRAYAVSGSSVTYGETKLIGTSPSSFVLLIDTISIDNSHQVSGRGIISGVGSLRIINFGFCWSFKPNPTKFDFLSQNGMWNGSHFIYENISAPLLDTTYHIRAYAVLSDSTTLYSPEKTFIVPSLKIQTDSLSRQSNTIALYGSFLNVGVDPIQEYGFCYSANNSIPTINDNKAVINSPITGPFFTSIPYYNGTNYYVRAYAIVNNKITYGQVVSNTIVSSLNCIGSNNIGTLYSNEDAVGIISSVGYTGGNGGIYSSKSFKSIGVTGLSANISDGMLNIGNGTIFFTFSGIPNNVGTANFLINIGGESCTLTRSVLLGANITSLNCVGATNNGNLIVGIAGLVNSSIAYTGGNGGPYKAQSISSIGVTGLLATLESGTLNYGNGTLNLTIQGKPESAGTATFLLNIGGQTCTLLLQVNDLSVGDFFGGGIIAYIYKPSDLGYVAEETHGFILAPSDQSNGQWGCAGSTIGGTSSDIGTGKANSNLIVSGCTTPGIAARICQNLSLSNYSDWYLPSAFELQQIYNNRNIIKSKTLNIGGFNFPSSYFWSSSEQTGIYSFILNFGNGNIYLSSKSENNNVRAIRAF
jgi:hypothetical protein